MIKARKCAVCKTRGPYKLIGLKAVCANNPECADILINETLLKIRKKQAQMDARELRQKEKEQRKKHKEAKLSVTPLATLCSTTQTSVNAYIRHLDHDLGCISCPGNVEHAGHYFHAGTKYRTSILRFMHENIHGQCLKCNSFQSGARERFTEGLIYRYGVEYVDQLSELRDRTDRGEMPLLTRDMVLKIRELHLKKNYTGNRLCLLELLTTDHI